MIRARRSRRTPQEYAVMSEGQTVPAAEFVGAVARFGFSALRRAPRALAYSGEVIRQIGLLCSGSALVVMFVCFLSGQSCGLESGYLARALSTPSLGAAATFGCGVVYVVPFLFGFILAAKVGCGFVAEIGAMRVADEVDALEVIGISSLTYLVTVRMLAAMVALPIIYMLAIGSADLGGFIQAGLRFADASRGTYTTYQYAFFGASDIVLSIAQGLVISLVVMTVSLYFGYSVRGGPVEVGIATARSMAVNLVAVTWVNLVFVIVFLLKARIPIG